MSLAPSGAGAFADTSNRFGLHFHHLGWIVPAPEAAASFLTPLGYRPGAQAYDPLQRVNLAMHHHDQMPDIELIWPGPEASPIDRLLRQGHMVYHIGYVTEDAEASLAALEAAGISVLTVVPPRPAVLFGGIPVSFHTLDEIGLIEFLHGVPPEGTHLAAVGDRP